MKLIDSINSPDDLKKLSPEQLPQVAEEIRELMLTYVSQSGGHLAPSLGTVDLSVSLHYCFDTPTDQIVWDVGHQAYAHKILTGRRDRFSTLRQSGGISGFPRISESPYDTVSVGHASTSISTALGLAVARDLQKKKHSVVAIIGDGSLSGGLAFEGLNNLGALSTKMIIVLNDNKMSISKNVGALSRYLTRVITDKRYKKLKDEVWELTGRLSTFGKGIRTLARNIDETIKHLVIPGKLFEDMGIQYFGPFDGHNIAELNTIFRFVKDHATGPVIVHALTTKGKGYSFAENDATKFHGISKFSLSTGTVATGDKTRPSYSEVFGKTLTEIGKKQHDVVAITAAMPDGTGLARFRDAFPDRFFDVGIAEEHAVSFAAGLALKGLKPVVAMYSTFLQRAFDQLVHDVALDKLHVVFCIDRAGIVGEDGPTHHGMFDLSFVRSIPGVVIMAPKNGSELVQMIYTAIAYDKGPVFIRYGRGSIPEESLSGNTAVLEPFEPEIIQKGNKIALVCVGDMVTRGEKAAQLLAKSNIQPTVVNARFIKPLSTDFYKQLFAEHSHIVTMESNTTTGGFGSGLIELAHAVPSSQVPEFLQLGYPDEFLEHGSNDQILKRIKLDEESIALRIEAFFNSTRIKHHLPN